MTRPADPTPLDATACPLLAKYGGPAATRLLDRFNAAVAEVRKEAADRLIGPLLAGAKFAGTLGLLDKARGLMARDKYVVGCIGITQAGKSTTVNNVLGEEVCKPGAMDATSSLPCRIIKSERRSLGLEWLTPGLIAERRQRLCEALGLPTPGPDHELVPMLDQPERFRLADGQEPPRLRDDLKYLKDFLGAVARGGGALTDPARVQADLPYDKRYEYTTHGRGGGGTEALLLREARFHVANARLPDDLELCDLPGLDSKRTIDDVVTWEYLPGLHGAFLFVNVGANLMTEGMLKILSRINHEFRGRVGGRAWVIFNKMDSLTGDSFRAGEHENVFGTIGRFLEKTGVPEAQVCFASKRIWDAAVAGGGIADLALSAQLMSQSAAAPTPPDCPPGLRGAWQDLLKDGGISRLRDLMFREVADALAGQIREDADRLLSEFERDFRARVAAERKRATMSATDLLAPTTCYTALLSLRAELANRPDRFAGLRTEMSRLRQSLEELFDNQATPERLAELSQDELAGQFATHARILDRILDGELSGELLERVYDAVGKELEGLPAVPVGPTQQGCQEAWRGYAFEDRAEAGWLATRPRFAHPEVADWLSRPTTVGISSDTYVALMREKIDSCVRQTAHLLRSRLRKRLGELTGELALLAGQPGADVA